MVNSKLLQNLYNDMYVIIRERLWPMSVINILANLEISIYDALPDLENVRKYSKDLEREVMYILDSDAYQKDLLTSIRDIIKYVEDGPSFLKLITVNEVIDK